MPAGIDEPTGSLIAVAFECRRHPLVGRASQYEKSEECDDRPGRPPQTK